MYERGLDDDYCTVVVNVLVLIAVLEDLDELVKGGELAQAPVDYVGDVVCGDKARAVEDGVAVRYAAVVVKGCHGGDLIPAEAGVAGPVGGQAVRKLAVLSQHLTHVVELPGDKPLQRVPLVHLGVKVEAEELEVGSERRQDAVEA